MLTNYHTHTTFCDGKNTAEEVVQAAIERGFAVIGFSGHGYTPYDTRYCMQDTQGYMEEIKRLKRKYAQKIEICLGVEEDSRAWVDRKEFDYTIGSCHYVSEGGKTVPFDSNYGVYTEALARYDGDALAFAEAYYRHFCGYILNRRPDIIGHFDLITKFDEKEVDLFLHNEKYWEIAEKYTLEALKSGCIFEVNTGLISRGYRKTPCPHERLLRIIAKNGGRVTLSSDSHRIETLDDHFEEMKKLLQGVGFDGSFALCGGVWKKDLF